METVHNLVLAVIGGAMIGVAAGVLMLANGRVMGASGLFAAVIPPVGTRWQEAALLVIGLPVGALLFVAAGGQVAPRLEASPAILIVGGLLVGFGTRLSAGCTSGHGVCGNAQLSLRSMVATVSFIATGILAVAVAGAL